MAIKTRSTVVVSASRQPRQPVRRPPTQSQLSAAAYRLADELGGRECDQETRDDAASKIYDFAAGSVSTAWSLVDAAIMAVRCYQGRRKISGAMGEVVVPFREALDEAKTEDLKSKAALIEELKAEGTTDERKDAIRGELNELLLGNIPQDRPFRMGSEASAFLLESMFCEFMPVKGSPLAVEDFPRFVQENLRFLDWLGVELLFTKEQNVQYQAAKDADKAERAAAGAEPAPDAEVESDEDSDVADAEVEEAPAAEAASA